MYAINGSTGSLRWKYTASYWVANNAAVGSDGTIFFGCYDGRVYAVGASGNLTWRFNAGDYVKGTPAIGPGGTIIFGSSTNKVYALNGLTGALLWNFTTGSSVEASPTVAADGTVYVGGLDTKVYALKPALPAQASPSSLPTPSPSPSNSVGASAPPSPSAPPAADNSSPALGTSTIVGIVAVALVFAAGGAAAWVFRARIGASLCSGWAALSGGAEAKELSSPILRA